MEATTSSTVAFSIAVEAGRLTCVKHARDKEGRVTWNEKRQAREKTHHDARVA